MTQSTERLTAGRNYPLGATWDGLGTNFAVFSANAEKIELCIFEASGRREIARHTLPECTDEVWHGYLPGARPGMIYGYRAHGPYLPQEGHRFNPHKLLLDPYAKQLTGNLHWTDSLFGYRLGGARGDLSFDRRDSAPAMAKAIVTDDAFNWGDDRSPDIPNRDTFLYELHARGASMRREDLPADERGTFAALTDPRFIDHLLKIGINAVELMPIHAFVQDRYLVDKGLRNYWGYNSLAFFAPEPAYLSNRTLDDLRIAVRRLHEAGIEVILDVVYNHTAEGNENGPTLSFRGLDNASYYRLVPGEERHYINDTGCGNTLNISHPRVLQLVMDSLRYWVNAFHIDGFRFDLGITLGREGDGYNVGSGFFDAIRQDPVLSRVKLFSEPWDIGPGGYQLGNMPPGFGEWNDRARDSIRRFWRGDEGMRASLARNITGSADLFEKRFRKPWSSVHFIAAHDGFTLRDLVSYAEKHNDANGEDNRDGHNDNCSANWGVEGPTDDPDIEATRRSLQRAMLATVLIAHGTPMLLAGDEFNRSQGGNNNAYCQDNELSWLNWHDAETPEGRALAAFVGRLAGIRRNFPVLRADHFFHEHRLAAPDLPEISWFAATGERMTPDHWHDAADRALVLRLAGPSLHAGQGEIDVLLVLMNAGDTPREFRIPTLPAGEPPRWSLILDSARAELVEAEDVGEAVSAPARSLLLVASRLEAPA
ncbi:MAG: glycogen debranching protein GlgX [Parvibaculum sp.]|uniref:glycogen debranching protein GlgX n=1 Tax=Parvibaculum sp. TaxID=2024848 RepID=UPI0025F2C9AC|nr:glycogen debranching protein GlgX [Parvibaculum sp.]MCE9649794.1 glycogen debranching protein GlgX [Parvibaculum sp.]